jgi:hypothetical protein
MDSRTKIGVGWGCWSPSAAVAAALAIDVAVPEPDQRALGGPLTGVWTRAFWREPDDVAARAGAAPSAIFTWPRTPTLDPLQLSARHLRVNPTHRHVVVLDLSPRRPTAPSDSDSLP